MPTPPLHPLHPLLELTLATAPLTPGHTRVVVDVERRTSFRDFPTREAAHAYAQDVLAEGDAPSRTLVLLFDADGQRLG